MTRTELAAGLGIDAGLVTRYAQRGMPTDSLPAAAAWKAANVRQRMTGKSTARAGRAAPAAPAGTVPPYAESRARREHAEALRAERAAALEAGQLVRVEDVKRHWGLMLTEFKTRLLGLPSRLAPVLAHKTIAEIDAHLADAIWYELNELSREKP